MMRFVIPMVLVLLISVDLIGQEKEEDLFRGVAVDLVPITVRLLNGNSSVSDFSFRLVGTIYNKSGRLKYKELGFTPTIRNTSTSQSNRGNTLYGLDAEYFTGRYLRIGKNWEGAYGPYVNLGYSRQDNNRITPQSGTSIQNITRFSAGLGYRFMFGLRISDRVTLKTQVSILAEVQRDNSKITTSGVESFSQDFTDLHLYVREPRSLEILFKF